VGAVVVVVGGTVVVVVGGVVVVVAGVVVVVELFPPDVAGVVVVGCVVVVGGTVVVVVGEVVVVVGSTRCTAGFAVEAKRPTRATDEIPEPTRTPRVTLRTRANRRSRCWGVR
jgi:hypothetical protein